MVEITINNQNVPLKSFVFPGGEVGIKVNTNYLAPEKTDNKVLLTARIKSSADLMELAMTKDALKRHLGRVPIDLFMPYIPYARQDRVCVAGEAFSLKVFADYINFLNFDKVTVVDPHSDVSMAVFNNLRVISQLDILKKFDELVTRAAKCVFVAPDAGANKKTSVLANYLGKSSFVRADKLRDLGTGNIKETIVYCEDFQGKDVVVFDDLCDGGRTFIELAKVCKTKNCGKFVLYVTHGIFSKGADELLNNGIDEIYCTDSYNTPEKVKFISLNSFVK